MKFQQAIDSALFKNYFNLEGKATRSEYWWFVFFVTLLFFATSFLALTVAVSIGLEESGMVRVGNYSIGIVLAVTFLPALGVSVRRFRDAGRGKEEALVAFFLAIITQLMMPIGDQEAIIRMPEIMTVPILVVGVAANFYILYIALKKSV
jgi:uncharacterized membrane protein YhaH (DUF805 family)|tara:strand:- start:191 stop:640 length:450 start_codon:yes stop_codon:yes gene_type:complete